ncbi:hypothetical protein B0H15DRAFT_502854 [Mycena belliarum]|uniref:Uncharacterized protein n=1 Tax=Mycena belliarum TaxID=1033014 RepID=A0AAD6UER2_9AGAR|nr:hypothetical protein B0H15DRAFT_502854 [Mycena belliae]
MLPVLGSRILGVSNMLARRIFRTSDQLNEVLRTPPLAQRDEVGWGIREPEPESHPPQSPPDSNPPATYPPADPTAPSLYKRRTLPPLPPLPLSPAEHAALPLMRAFPGIGGGLPFSLQHALAAASGLLGSPIPPSAPPDLHVRPNPVVGVGEGQPRHVRSRPGARPFPTSAAGAPLNFFKRSPKRFPFMTPYYLSTPPPPPPLPPLDPAVARRPSLASALQKRLAGRVRH